MLIEIAAGLFIALVALRVIGGLWQMADSAGINLGLILAAVALFIAFGGATGIAAFALAIAICGGGAAAVGYIIAILMKPKNRTPSPVQASKP